MSKINNYEELIAERKNLEANLRSQKAYLNTQVTTIKQKFEPITKFIAFVGGFKKHPGSSLLKIGSDVGIDLLARNKLAKAGWLARLVLPLVLKFTAARTIDKLKAES